MSERKMNRGRRHIKNRDSNRYTQIFGAKTRGKKLFKKKTKRLFIADERRKANIKTNCLRHRLVVVICSFISIAKYN